ATEAAIWRRNATGKREAGTVLVLDGERRAYGAIDRRIVAQGLEVFLVCPVGGRIALIEPGKHVAVRIQDIEKGDEAVVRRPLGEQGIALFLGEALAGGRLLAAHHRLQDEVELLHAALDVGRDRIREARRKLLDPLFSGSIA